MLGFSRAVRQHDVLERSAAEDEESAVRLWDALAGHGEPAPDSFEAAVLDTVPEAHATLIASSDVVAAYAFGCHWARMRAPGRRSSLAMRDAAREGWARFVERADATEDLVRGFGFDRVMAWTTHEDVDVRQGHMLDVQRVARLAGRMYAAMRGAKARRVTGMPEEVHDIEQGNKLARLLPSELVQLVDDDYGLPAMARLIESRSLQYAMRGSSPAAKGPLVMALDESGSMHGRRREWSKAAAVALMRVAFEEKREVAVVHWSTSVVVRHIKPGDAQGVLNMVRHFLGGGNDVGRALLTSVDAVRDLAKKGQHGADIVLITDGQEPESHKQAEAIDAADKLGARLWTVAIECAIDVTSPLRARAAHYVELGAAQMADAKSAVALNGAVS